jgi:hypothetical protein
LERDHSAVVLGHVHLGDRDELVLLHDRAPIGDLAGPATVSVRLAVAVLAVPLGEEKPAKAMPLGASATGRTGGPGHRFTGKLLRSNGIAKQRRPPRTAVAMVPTES